MCFIKYRLGPIEVIYDREDNIKTELSLCAEGPGERALPLPRLHVYLPWWAG